jgi:hypothetical protein
MSGEDGGKKTHHCCDKVSRREEKAIGIVSSFLAH